MSASLAPAGYFVLLGSSLRQSEKGAVIGEQNPKQLAALSAAEQAGYFTPPWVIARLAWLKGVYERR